MPSAKQLPGQMEVFFLRRTVSNGKPQSGGEILEQLARTLLARILEGSEFLKDGGPSQGVGSVFFVSGSTCLICAAVVVIGWRDRLTLIRPVLFVSCLSSILFRKLFDVVADLLSICTGFFERFQGNFPCDPGSPCICNDLLHLLGSHLNSRGSLRGC